MPSTTALFSALSGLNANARNIDVIGNNVANTNTTAFKSTRMMFSSVYSRTLSGGTAPRDTTGGTNPNQIGFGVNVAGTQRNFNSGAVNATGDARDLAIEGDGFFIVRQGTETFYTRAGAFRPNAERDLTTISGERLQGYGVDADFNIVTGSLVDLSIPIGGLPIAEATSNVTLAGTLNAAGDLPTRGSITSLGSSETAGFGLIAAASPAPGAGNVLELTSRLVDIETPSLPGSGTPLLSAGQTIQMRSAEKGNKVVPTALLPITATTTVQDLATFLTQALGIDTTVGANPDERTPGVTLDTTTGRLTVVGNTGEVNSIDLDATDLQVLDAAGSAVASPFTPTTEAEANGESVRTTFAVFDSLGGTVELDASLVLDSRTSTSTTWRYYIESADDTDLNLQVATGTLSFDTAGRLTTLQPVVVNLDRVNQGVTTPLSFTLRFQDDLNVTSSVAAESSSLSALFRDGAQFGVLDSASVGEDGVISGSFTNGMQRTIGQLVLATFTNNEGLVDEGGNLFRPGANSGIPTVTTPQSLGAGTILGGALELSNVDLGEEFIKLIQASTGYSANSRVIRTTDELMQQLLVIGR
jgi:flagellar hook protein FlgE